MTEALPFPGDRSAGLPPLVGGRFRPRERLDARGPFERWAADETAGVGPVVLLSEPDQVVADPTTGPAWPSIAWEDELRRRVGSFGLPRVLDRFAADGRQFVV